MLLADDVIDLSPEESVLLRDQAVLANAARA